MERKRQREIALVAVAVLLVVTAVWTMMPAATGTNPSARPSPGPRAAAGSAPPPQNALSDVDLGALNGLKAEPQEIVRNPFRFRPKPPPPPPPPPPRPTTPLQTGPVEPPAPPRIPLKFLGILDIPGKGIYANLSDGRGVYRGREGDVIEGRYRIVHIGVESIELAYLDGRGRQTIRQTGQ